MTPLWTSADIARVTHGHTTGTWDVDGISIDSRSISAGDLFIAVKGPRFDGHDFFNEALDRGAAAAMVSVLPEDAKQTVKADRLIVVDDTMAGLSALAAAARSRTDARIAAVTGSVGKTTTKESLAMVLGRQGHSHATVGNLNNHWGAPLSLARMPLETDYGVFELGMNHAGEIEPLSRLVRPHVTTITAIEAVHMENFSSLDGIADAKAEIFVGLERGGTAVIPADSPFHDKLASAAKTAGAEDIVTFGTDRSAAFRLIAWTMSETGTRIAADVNGRRIVFEIGLRGQHMAMNSLAVLATVSALGGDPEQAAGDLYDMKPPEGRGLIRDITLDNGSFTLIDESYNASPASVRALINTLSSTCRTGRVLLVLGDMLELGPEADARHVELASAIETAGLDAVYTAGPLMAHLHNALPQALARSHATDSHALTQHVIDDVEPGDVVAVKGSFGSRMAVIVDALIALDRADSSRNQTVVNGD